MAAINDAPVNAARKPLLSNIIKWSRPVSGCKHPDEKPCSMCQGEQRQV